MCLVLLDPTLDIFLQLYFDWFLVLSKISFFLFSLEFYLLGKSVWVRVWDSIVLGPKQKRKRELGKDGVINDLM